MEPCKWSTLNQLVIFILLFQGVFCDTFFILTATANPCPAPFTWDQCITLQRFATNSPSHGSTVMLILESGSHSLDSGFSLSNIQNFTMVPQVSSDRPTITCSTGTSSSSQSFTLVHVSHIVWQGITFNGCTSRFRSSVHSVTFSDVSFANSGITLEDVIDSVQLTSVDFTDSLRSSIEGLENSTSIQLRNVTFMGQYGIELHTVAEITVEDSIVQQVSITSLYISHSPKVSIVRCQFLNNNLGDTRIGGGLYLTEVTAKISDSIFYNNHALCGAAVNADSVDLTIDGTNFTSNAATSLGGALSMGTNSNLTVTNTVFVTNTAGSGSVISGSGIQNMKVVNCTFSGNHNNPISTTSGGNLLIMNSTFHDNSGTDAGALSDRDTRNYTIIDCSFISNRAYNGKGGAIVKYSTALIIRRSIFSGNSASQNGGAIYTSGTLLAEWTNFTNNVATNQGGAIEGHTNQGFIVQIYLINCHITANAARDGALHLNGDHSSIYIDSSHFVGNNGSIGGGGAIHHEGQYTNISIMDSSFYNNSAASCGVLDINNTNHQSVKFIRSDFSSNRATGTSRGGGVICIRSAVISLTSCTFNGNHAALNAGVLNIEDSVVTVDRCSFVNNSADVNGGVAYSNAYPTTYSVRLSTFLNNSAGGSGGAFYMGMVRSRVNMEKSSFGSNSAKNRGGLIAINGSQLLIDNQTNVFENRASFGTAISACSSEVTVPSELIITGDSTGCKFYSGNINRYNISDFIRQEFTTAAPITTATTLPITTIPTTPFINGSHTHSSPPMVTTPTKNIMRTSPHTVEEPVTAVVNHQGTDTDTQAGGDTTNYAKIAVAISCVSLILTVGLCALVGIFLGIKIFFMITKRRSSRSWDRNNDFLLQEDKA